MDGINMTKNEIPMIRIHDLATDTIIDREMNEEELTQLATDRAQDLADRAAIAAKDETKQAVIDKLGLTAEEIAALLG